MLISLKEEKDLVIIGGGVAGYVAAIRAGQSGLKVRRLSLVEQRKKLKTDSIRSLV